MTDVSFQHLPDKTIPDKGNIREEEMTEDITRKIDKQEMEKDIRKATDTEPEKDKKGSFTKDVPQLAFRFVAVLIPCPKFNLSDEDATVFAEHLNILVPIGGKYASVIVLTMIILNKVFVCMDAIQARSKPKMDNEQPGFAEKEEEKPTRVNVVQ
jgi:hypothetical protein